MKQIFTFPDRDWLLPLRGVALLCLLAVGAAPALAQTSVARFGALQVQGNRVLDRNGQPVRLASNSLSWSNNGWGG